MTIQRLENGIVVDDLAAATAFFVELGLKVLVSSAIPIRHTGICWPWLASSACAFHVSVVDTIILGVVWCGLGSVGSSRVLWR